MNPKFLKIAIEDVEKYILFRATVDRIALKNIIWTRGGKTVPVNSEDWEAWRFVGMSNLSFCEMVLINQDSAQDSALETSVAYAGFNFAAPQEEKS